MTHGRILPCSAEMPSLRDRAAARSAHTASVHWESHGHR